MSQALASVPLQGPVSADPLRRPYRLCGSDRAPARLTGSLRGGEAAISRRAYPSDITDAQWRAVEPVVASSALGGDEQSQWTVREVVNGISYALASGCKWSMLPHEFPPWGLVHSYFRRWRNDGTWDRLRGLLPAAPEEDEQVGAATGKESPIEGEGVLSPVRLLRVTRMCPYLGSRSDGMTRRAYPSTQNVCRAEPGSHRKVNRETQDALCLGEDHLQCEYYRARVEAGGEGAGAGRATGGGED